MQDWKSEKEEKQDIGGQVKMSIFRMGAMGQREPGEGLGA